LLIALSGLLLWLSGLRRWLASLRYGCRFESRMDYFVFFFVVKLDFEIDCRHFVFLLDLTFKLSTVSINYAAYSVN